MGVKCIDEQSLGKECTKDWKWEGANINVTHYERNNDTQLILSREGRTNNVMGTAEISTDCSHAVSITHIFTQLYEITDINLTETSYYSR